MADQEGHSELLHRILATLEGSRRQNGLDLLLAVLLSVTALASTWCAYQSQLWNGVQVVTLADAEIATQLSNEKTLAATLRKTMDALILFQYLEARQRNNTGWAEVIHRGMPTTMREAVDAWLKLDPEHNPDAPPPGQLAQYVLTESQEAEQARQQAATLRNKAQQAGHHGDDYVLLTMLFALVLFFAGIACTVQPARLRWGLTILACLLFVITAFRLGWVPVCTA